MAVDLEFLPSIIADLDEAYLWYELRRVGLGEEFLGSVNARISQLVRFPELFPVVHHECRRALVRRFPYAIFYQTRPESIVILAVLHTARDPEKWRQRLP